MDHHHLLLLLLLLLLLGTTVSEDNIEVELAAGIAVEEILVSPTSVFCGHFSQPGSIYLYVFLLKHFTMLP